VSIRATIIVLGMHRSFTSLVAGGLWVNGTDMGRTMIGPGKGNKLGHFENAEFVRLNDELLREAGGAWNKPPPEDKIMAAGKTMEKRIKKTIRTAERAPIWGWKDPRTTLTLPAYLPHVKKPILVPCFRQPDDVARSLQRRDGTSIKDGMALAAEYNRRLVGHLARFGGIR